MAGRSGSPRPWSNPSRPWSDTQSDSAIAKELIGATLTFALLCGLAAAVRNFIQRRITESQ